MRAIRSALEQTYKDVEVIVSDDASTDNTLEMVRQIKDPRLKVFAQETRLGIVANPNFALHQATGEFLMFMGDDDVLLPTAFEKLLEPLVDSGGNDVGMSWCPCNVTDAKGNHLWSTEAGPAIETTASMLSEMFAGNRGPRCSSILLRTEDVLSVGGYEEKYGDLSDIGNWGRAALLHRNVACIQEPLVVYTMHGGSTTSRSSVAKWQAAARLVLADMIKIVRERGDRTAERQLRKAEGNFLSGVTMTILIQTIGAPGWINNCAKETWRYPRAIVSAYSVRRVMKDGSKMFLLRKNARRLRAEAQRA